MEGKEKKNKCDEFSQTQRRSERKTIIVIKNWEWFKIGLKIKISRWEKMNNEINIRTDVAHHGESFQ